jgi:hypothetical protein
MLALIALPLLTLGYVFSPQQTSPAIAASPEQTTKSHTEVPIPKLGVKAHFTNRRSMQNPHPLKRFIHRRGVIPATVLPVDSTGNATVSCPMDGNDTLGDCGEAMACHCDNILTFQQGKGTESVFSLSALEAQYEKVSGGDNGLDEDMVVNQIWKVGIAGNAAAIITDALDMDVTNVPLTQFAIDQFYTVELAWSVPDAFIQGFATGTVWPAAGIPDPNNGHYTPLASVRTGTVNGVDVTGFYELWTWGTYCLVSPAFVASVQPQAFVAFSPRQFDPATGLDSKGRHITTQAVAWVSCGGNPIPQAVIDAFPPVVPTPPPPVTTTPAFTLNIPNAIKAGQTFRVRAGVAIPAGTYQAFPTTSAAKEVEAVAK